MPYIYYVQMDIPDALDAELNRIYDTEHVPMLSKVPGVRRVTRYRREHSNDTRMQKYLAIYEIDSPEIVESKAWEEGERLGRLGGENPAAHDQPAPQLFPRDIARRQGPRRRLAVHLCRADGHPGGARGRVQPRLRCRARADAGGMLLTARPATFSKNRTTAGCRNTW